jgi:class 3 adenylate cyclase
LNWNKNEVTAIKDIPNISGVSLTGLYVIIAVSTAVGILFVFILNLATPMHHILNQIADLTGKDPQILSLELAKRLLFLLVMTTTICSLPLLAMHLLLRPIRFCLDLIRSGREPQFATKNAAQRRILNLPFIFIGINVGMWLLVPAVIFFMAFAIRQFDFHTSVVFTIRASMVGLISTAISFFRIESYTRKHLIPFFFPEGQLATLKGAARMPISRRIRMFFRLGTMVPLAILVVTLLTVQWEVGSADISAAEYGRGIITFTVVLCIIFFLTGGALNRLVNKSIVEPIENMLENVKKIREGDFESRIQVVGNDEIGVLGDAGNDMIRGLAERETLRSTFGRYITPEIRDEILSGRIPMEGERREATVMFADLRDFTPFVEDNSPEEVITGMRAYFTAMHRAIQRNRGLVLQFVGDEIEAVFGVPVHFGDHADAAIKSALEMRQALQTLNKERADQKKSAFSHGIGIHSGIVLAGNSGSEDQSAYALIGNTVNVASRIQGLTKDLGCDILASHETIERLEDKYKVAEQPPQMVKGYSKQINIYHVLG